jgi:hypothetical protein
MGAQDFQLMVGDESTWNTPATVNKTFEYESESIEESYGRTEGQPLRRGTAFPRNDRFTPYFAGAAGNVQLAVMTKGFGFWLKHMMGQVATTGPTETTVYTHTGTEASLLGKGITMQVNRPLNPAGTDQPFTYAGGKIVEWTVSNSVEGNLLLDLSMDFASGATATALATASYPSSMDNLTWVGGVVSIGGTNVDLDEFSLNVKNGNNVDRRKIRASADKKEQLQGKREGSFSLKCDFESLTQRNRAAALTRAGALAAVVATWKGPTLLGTTIYPEFTVNIAAARFDDWKAATQDYDAIGQELSGAVTWDGTNSPVQVIYKSADVTP